MVVIVGWCWWCPAARAASVASAFVFLSGAVISIFIETYIYIFIYLLFNLYIYMYENMITNIILFIWPELGGQDLTLPKDVLEDMYVQSCPPPLVL